MSRITKIYCGADLIEVRRIANHLEYLKIPHAVSGEISTMVMGIENASQEVCILVDEPYLQQAAEAIDDYLSQLG